MFSLTKMHRLNPSCYWIGYQIFVNIQSIWFLCKKLWTFRAAKWITPYLDCPNILWDLTLLGRLFEGVFEMCVPSKAPLEMMLNIVDFPWFVGLIVSRLEKLDKKVDGLMLSGGITFCADRSAMLGANISRIRSVLFNF